MQVVFATMSVAPSIRLSEEILAKAILAFYVSSKLVPAGVTEEALEEWSAKMGAGLRKLGSKFRRLFWETPGNAKSPGLKQLKQRCIDAGISRDVVANDASESSSRAASHEDLDNVAPAPSKASSSFDWSRLQQRLKQCMGDKLDLLAESKGLKKRPVATPIRGKDGLPDFV